MYMRFFLAYGIILLLRNFQNLGKRVKGMKKSIIALGLAAAAAFSTMTVSAEQLWKYNDALTIDVGEADLDVDKNGHQVLTFTGVEQIEGGTNTYTYVYDMTARTIQIKEMEQETEKLHYTTSFNPAPIDSPNPVIRERAEMAQQVYEMIMAKKHK